MSQPEYDISLHGDLLEQVGAVFIRTKFPFYEKVWQTYIGNTGNARMASLPNYPREEKRLSFSEHSYTTFESCFMIQHILDSKVFMTEINSLERYVDFNKSFITFFTYLGRIRDVAIKASDDLGYDNRNFKTRIPEFYEARSIVVHGKKVPMVYDELGLIKMPVLATERVKGYAWNDKGNSWSDISSMPTTFIEDNCQKYFDDLLSIVNNEYANFYSLIEQELKTIPTTLLFDRSDGATDHGRSGYTPPSGSASAGGSPAAIDVYRINEFLAKKRGL